MDPIGNKDLETTFNDDLSTDVAFEKELNDWLEGSKGEDLFSILML